MLSGSVVGVVGWLLGDSVSSGDMDWDSADRGVGASLWNVDGHLSILVDSSVDVSQVNVLWEVELASERSEKRNFQKRLQKNEQTSC